MTPLDQAAQYLKAFGIVDDEAAHCIATGEAARTLYHLADYAKTLDYPWEPIETAPKVHDDTNVPSKVGPSLRLWVGWEIRGCYSHVTKEWHNHDHGGWTCSRPPTHWRPLKAKGPA